MGGYVIPQMKTEDEINGKAIRFYEKYGFRFDGTQQEILLGTPNTEPRMIYERVPAV